MDTVFVSKLKPLLDAVAESRDVYVPRKVGGHYVHQRYDPDCPDAVEFSGIRMCTPVKEFVFPLCELAAVFPDPAEGEDVKPFAVFGLKACDLRAIEVLDKVFLEDEFEDPLYRRRRERMFIVASDCLEPGESCFCSVLDGKPYASDGFDLNVSPVEDGFIVRAGSSQGRNFLFAHAALFADVPDALLAERNERREQAEKRLRQINADFQLDAPVKQVVEERYESDVFDDVARTCVECQACTRVCPTCHCFYLYDTKRKDYFGKMKMWDSCMRMAYAEVAGGANPRKRLGDRLRQRFMHKFVYFLDRYGIAMCVGCGRCIDAEAGDVDIRVVLKRLNDELRDKGRKIAKATR